MNTLIIDMACSMLANSLDIQVDNWLVLDRFDLTPINDVILTFFKQCSKYINCSTYNVRHCYCLRMYTFQQGSPICV